MIAFHRSLDDCSLLLLTQKVFEKLRQIPETTDEILVLHFIRIRVGVREIDEL